MYQFVERINPDEMEAIDACLRRNAESVVVHRSASSTTSTTIAAAIPLPITGELQEVSRGGANTGIGLTCFQHYMRTGGFGATNPGPRQRALHQQSRPVRRLVDACRCQLPLVVTIALLIN